MEITKSTDPQSKPSVVMMVYGNGGVGKTTFASTAPKPLLIDCENGAKYFGMRGIEVDVAKIKEWSDLDGVFDIAKSGDYETIIIDPIGELMEKLKHYMVTRGDKKLVQSDGSPSMAGWGWLKDTMRKTIKLLRDSGVNLILVAHVDEKPDEDKIIKRPMLMTKLSDEIVNMVDIVGYMTVLSQGGDEDKRVIMVDPASDKYIAKDRTGQLGKLIPPQFSEIVEAVQGTKKFKWSSEDATEAPKEKKAPAKKTAKKTTSKKTTSKKKAEAEDDGVEVEA
jgi:phage nucleotide-binding protein